MICIPIKKTNITSTLDTIEKAKIYADIFEIWFDEIKGLNEKKLSNLLAEINKPIIYKHQGNKKNLQMILKFKPRYIDLDIKSEKKIINYVKKNSSNTKIIISYHDFKTTPPLKNLREITEKIKKLNADIIKIATKANSLSDSLCMLSLLNELNQKKTKTICVCMGEKGEITRRTGHLFGNYLMYAPLNKKDSTAEGQICAKELKQIIDLI